MSLMDLIAQAGGSSAAERLGARAGLSPEQTQSAMAALAPSLAGGFRRQVEGGQLERTLATAKPGAEDADDEEAGSRGNDILGQIFGSKDVSRSVAQDASAKTGIGVDQLKAFLPLLASLAAGALSSRAGAGSGGLQGLVGMLDRDGDGSPLNDLMGGAGKLFGR